MKKHEHVSDLQAERVKRLTNQELALELAHLYKHMTFTGSGARYTQAVLESAIFRLANRTVV